jgi:hypothetical protein
MIKIHPYRFRKLAEESRQHAEEATNLRDKVAWLTLAAEWSMLAKTAEDRDKDSDSD